MITIALPKGRILKELCPLLLRANICIEDEFFDENSRKLQFKTNHQNIRIIRVRSFDVSTYVAYGAAQIGVVGSDVLKEFSYQEIYAPINLHIGKCQMCVASHKKLLMDDSQKSHVRIASKYPLITQNFYAKKNIQADIIKLSGAMELAPILQLSDRIVDLVETGKTLEANHLKIDEKIMDVSSYLILSRPAYKTLYETIHPIVESIREIIQ